MPINKIVPTKRAKAALAAVAVTLGATGAFYPWGKMPPAVDLAADSLIKPWEGLVLVSHWDQFSKRYDICYGDTLIDSKPVQPGMRFTKQQCDVIFAKRVYRDYYLPLTKCIPNFTNFPVSVQAAQISGAYNFGTQAMCRSSAAKLAQIGKYREACEAQTAFNKAGGQVLTGLVNRREMGDQQRIGEAELCVSGI